MATLPPVSAVSGFIKPTLDTPFHIDYSWWQSGKYDLRVELLKHMCPEHQALYRQQTGVTVDWIDWETGEVRQVDGAHYIITKHCSQQPGYITQGGTLLEMIFRVFLSNGNQPLSAREISALVGQPPEQVLSVISQQGSKYKGLRPAAR